MKLYLHGSSAPAVSPAYGDDWADTSGATRRRLVAASPFTGVFSPRPGNNLDVPVPAGLLSFSSGIYVLAHQFVSDPLPAGVPIGADTFSAQCFAREQVASDNVRTACSLRIFSEDGTTEQTTLLSVGINGNAVELSTTSGGKNSNLIEPDTPSEAEYITVAGDRIVFEIGFLASLGTTPQAEYCIGASIDTFGSGADATADDDTQTANSPGWIDFNNGFGFERPVAIATLTAPEALFFSGAAICPKPAISTTRSGGAGPMGGGGAPALQRFYFPKPAAAPADVTPAYNSWNYTAEAVRAKLLRDRLPDNSDIPTLSVRVGAWTANSANGGVVLQAISDPLAAGINFNGATVKCYCHCKEWQGSDEVRTRISVRLVSQDGSTYRSPSVLALGHYGTTLELFASTGLTNARNAAFAVAGTVCGNVTSQAGDRLVVELGGGNFTPSQTSPEMLIKIGASIDSAGTGLDATESEGQTVNAPGWIEFGIPVPLLSTPVITGASPAGRFSTVPTPKLKVTAKPSAAVVTRVASTPKLKVTVKPTVALFTLNSSLVVSRVRALATAAVLTMAVGVAGGPVIASPSPAILTMTAPKPNRLLNREVLSLVRSSASIATIDGDGTEITVTLTATYPNSNLKRGQWIKVSGTSNYNGTYQIKSITSQTSFKLNDSTNAAQETTGTVGGDYATLLAWESAERANLTTLGYDKAVECYDDFTSGISHNAQLQFTTANWTTSRTRKIRIRVPNMERTAFQGAFGSGVYIINNSTTFSTGNHLNGMIQIQCGVNIEILGLEVNATGTGNTNSARGIQVFAGTGGGCLLLDGVIIRGSGHTDGLDVDAGSGGTPYLIQAKNLVIVGGTDDGVSFSDDGGAGFDTTSYIHSSVVYGYSDMGFHSYSGCEVVLKNCAAVATGVDFEGGAGFWGSGTGYNASADSGSGAAFGTGAITGITAANVWTSPGTDFTLKDRNSVLVNAGTTAGVTHTRDIRTYRISKLGRNIGAYENPGVFGLRSYSQRIALDDDLSDKSGLAYHDGEGILYCIQNGSPNNIRKFNLDGSEYGSEVAIGALADDTEAIVYLGEDHPSGRNFAWLNEGDESTPDVDIVLFNLDKDASSCTNKVLYDLDDIPTVSGSYGAEALAYRPSVDKFYVGTQSCADADDGGLWEVDINTSPPTQKLLLRWYDTLVAKGVIASTGFVADFHYREGDGHDESIFVILNSSPLASGATKVVEMDFDGNVLSEFTGAPNGQIEGLVILPTQPQDMYLVQDTTGGTDFWKFSWSDLPAPAVVTFAAPSPAIPSTTVTPSPAIVSFTAPTPTTNPSGSVGTVTVVPKVAVLRFYVVQPPITYTPIYLEMTGWSYYYGSTNQFNASPPFYDLSFDFSGWSTGQAMVGAGALDWSGGTRTVRTNIGTLTTGRPQYLIREFALNGKVIAASVQFYRDDGIAFWWNGTQEGASNPGPGPPYSATGPGTAIGSLDEGAIQSPITLTPGNFVNGTNRVAFVNWNHTSSSTDLGADMILTVTLAPPVVARPLPAINDFIAPTATTDVAAPSGETVEPSAAVLALTTPTPVTPVLVKPAAALFTLNSSSVVAKVTVAPSSAVATLSSPAPVTPIRGLVAAAVTGLTAPTPVTPLLIHVESAEVDFVAPGAGYPITTSVAAAVLTFAVPENAATIVVKPQAASFALTALGVVTPIAGRPQAAVSDFVSEQHTTPVVVKPGAAIAAMNSAVVVLKATTTASAATTALTAGTPNIVITAKPGAAIFQGQVPSAKVIATTFPVAAVNAFTVPTAKVVIRVQPSAALLSFVIPQTGQFTIANATAAVLGTTAVTPKTPFRLKPSAAVASFTSATVKARVRAGVVACEVDFIAGTARAKVTVKPGAAVVIPTSVAPKSPFVVKPSTAVVSFVAPNVVQGIKVSAQVATVSFSSQAPVAKVTVLGQPEAATIGMTAVAPKLSFTILPPPALLTVAGGSANVFFGASLQQQRLDFSIGRTPRLDFGITTGVRIDFEV